MESYESYEKSLINNYLRELIRSTLTVYIFESHLTFVRTAEKV